MENGKYVDVDGAKLYYESSGTGIPAIFLHTAGTDGRVWKEFVSMLPENINAIVPDLPGHGKSWPWNQWRRKRVDVRFYSEKILKMADILNLEKFIIVGCSIGADIALDLCVMAPDRIKRAVIMEGAAKTKTFEVETIMKTDPGNVERAFDFCGSNASKENIENLIWIRSSNNRDIYINDLLAWNSFDNTHLLDGCKVEINLVRGAEDPVVTDEMLIETSKFLTDCKVESIPGLGHYPMLENPAKCMEKIGKMLTL